MRDEFLITRQGKQYVLFAGLLDEAHNRGLKGIDTELVQVPTEENGNVAVVKARVEMEGPEGLARTFSGIGDASPDNVGRNIVPHIIRMAETRAKARALRDAVNVGATALEELSDGDDAPPASYPPVRASSPRGLQEVSGRPPADERAASPAPPNGGDGESPEAAQGASEGGSRRSSRRGSGGSSGGKARKSQVDLLRTLAEELRGENGVARLEGRIGKPLDELSRAEADEWIDRLTPAEGRE
jgi:hypothetical protein